MKNAPVNVKIQTEKWRPFKASIDQPMQMTTNFLQLDQMMTSTPIKHFQKHVGAQSDDKLDKLFSFSVNFHSFVWLSNSRENLN